MLFYMAKKISKPKLFMTVKRLSDIENGKVMPTLEEFVKLCILYKMPEAMIMKKSYPRLYARWEKEIDLTPRHIPKKGKRSN